MATAIALAFSVMDGKELAELQGMVFGSTVVRTEAGAMAFKLADQAETHLNTYRSHLPQLLVEGALYQFEDFFTGIRATLGSLFPGMESVMAFLAKAREVAGEADASLPKTETAPTGSSGRPSSGSSPASPS